MPDAFSPSALPVIIETIPMELKACRQWVVWRYEFQNGKWTKVPKNPHTGYNAKSDTPNTWGTFGIALACSRKHGMAGIGFVFSVADAFAGIDLDKCRNPVTGRLELWALRIIQEIDSYTEVSPSGTGVKLFMRAKLPPGGNRKGQIECYDRRRYFTVTGHHLLGTSHIIEDRQAELTTLHRRIFQATTQYARVQAFSNGKPGQPLAMVANAPSHLHDEALICRALAAKNGLHFAQLWSGDISGHPSHSEADAALCAMLAFWCGPDPDRIDRLFRQSGLYRPKWDQRHYSDGQTYGQATITRAQQCVTAGYGTTQWGMRTVVWPSDRRPLRTMAAQEVLAWRR
jgi:putative DNA primase/helicase